MNCDRDEDGMQDTRSIMSGEMVCVRWPILYALYGKGNSLSKGTIFAVTASECHVIGMLSVEVGMRLRLWGGPREKPEPFQITEATVVWAKGHEFGLALHTMGVVDQRWIRRFLAEALRRSLHPLVA